MSDEAIKEIKTALIERMKERVMESVLGRELLEIFLQDNLTCVFQPIVGRVSQKVYAFEALMRGPFGTSLNNPLNILKVADNHGVLFEVDTLARLVSLESFAKQKEAAKEALLFLNISVASVLSGDHQSGLTHEALNILGIDPDRVVIEITELEPIEDYGQFMQAVNYYRELGFKVAVDDLGSGYNGLRIWSELRPDYVKVDRHFVTNIHKHPEKKRFVETMVALAKGLQTKLVAEGMETPEELKVLNDLEVDLFQGYLFKHPEENISQKIDYQWLSNKQTYTQLLEPTNKDILEVCHTLNPNENVEDIMKMMLNNAKPEFYPVIDSDGTIMGILWRRDFMENLAKRFWLELNHRKTIKEVMDKSPLVFDINMTLVDVSKAITDSDNSHKGEAFLISKKGKYVGCAAFNDLLKIMTNLKMKSAQYANPLSGLPGNVPIQNNIRELLTRNVYFEMIYIDVDHFKPYNDYYSFEQGDDVIRLISDILKKLDLSFVTDQDLFFIGHIGGDDFVILSTHPKSYLSICEQIIQTFSEEIPSFYSEEDRQREGIEALDRDGNSKFFPIMSLSLGVSIVRPDHFNHTQQLASFATKSKKGAKQTSGNGYFVIDSSEIKTEG